MFHRHWAIMLGLCLAGCQAYEPIPVDWSAHDRDWSQRSPAGGDVRAFAEELAALNAGQRGKFDPSNGLSLPEAEVVALMFNPSLRTGRLRAKVSQVGAGEAGRWDDPHIEFEALRILESIDKPWLLGGSIGFTIPISGRLAVEKEKAIAEANTEVYRVWLEEAKVVAALREAWAQKWSNQRRVTEIQSYLEQIDRVLPIAQRQRELGRIGSTEARVFLIERATRAAELATLRAEGARLDLTIKALLGLKPDAPITLDLQPPLSVEPGADVAPALHPRMQLAKAEYESAEQSLRLEIRKQFPDLEIGPAYEYEAGEEKAGLTLSLPLPILNANRRAIAEARASRDAARAALEGELETLTGDIAAARAAVAAAVARRSAIERDVVPLVDQQLDDLRKQAELGEFDSLFYLDALTRSFETKLQVLDAYLAEAVAHATLRSLVEPAINTSILKNLSDQGAQP